jgi:hypothetical protein
VPRPPILGPVLNRIRPIAIVMASLFASMVAVFAISPAAYATRLLPVDESGSSQAAPLNVPSATAHHGGVAGWEVGLIAVGVVVLASALAIVVVQVKARSALRRTAS